MIYQDLADLEIAVQENNPDITAFDSSCFSGKYITDGVDSDYLSNLEKSRVKAER